MTSAEVQVTFDCAEPAALARFWAAALDYAPPDIEGTHEVLRALGHAEDGLGNWYRIEDPSGRGPKLAFQRGPEPKICKNRLHLDLKPAGEGDAALFAEVARVVALGATQLRQVTDEAGIFVVLEDPEGNEFCVG